MWLTGWRDSGARIYTSTYDALTTVVACVVSSGTAASNMSLSWTVLLKEDETSLASTRDELDSLEICHKMSPAARQTVRCIHIFTEATTQPLANAT